MREAFVLASCDRKRCSETWQAEVDAPPVTITLPDGRKAALDLCPGHIDQLSREWLSLGYVVAQSTAAPAQRQSPAVAPRTSVPTVEQPKKRKRRKRRVPPSERAKVDCPVNGCASYGTSASSMQAHIRKSHNITGEEASQIISNLFGTRPARRVPCPDCGEDQAVHFLTRHRKKEHGVAA